MKRAVKSKLPAVTEAMASIAAPSVSARDKAASAVIDPVPARYRITDYPMHYFAVIQRQNQANLARILRSAGLSVQMWRALSALYDQNAQTIGQIADMTVLDRSSLGRLLEEMAADGLVVRESPADDRRAVLIRLSATGRRRFESVLPRVQTHYRRLLHGVSGEDFATLMRVLRRVKANGRILSDPATLDEMQQE